jgi:hypothetical protein
MTQNEHTWLALFILMIIYQPIWHLLLKHHPVTQKNRKEWLKILGKYF